ncbi:MAG: carbohydrate kinase [Fusobacterium sp.]|nr:carbohydrate kinase [Fusobacterium sp.]
MKYGVTALGELLIDFTTYGTSENGMKLFEQNPGGAPANVLVALQNLGINTAFIGKVGDDMHGHFLKNTLNKFKINTDNLILDKDFFTTLAFVNLKDGEREFSFARKPGADTQLKKEEIDVEILKNSKIFHFGSLSLTNEPSKTATLFSISEAKKNGLIISYDPNYRALLWDSKEIAIKEMRSVIKYVDIIKISDEETELLTGEKSPSKAGDILLKQGVSCVVITLGADGALLKTKNFEIQSKGKKREVIDTTGAGDSFWGAILYKFITTNKTFSDLTENDGYEFLKFANCVAGLCIEKRGAIPAIPKLDEVLKDLEY